MLLVSAVYLSCARTMSPMWSNAYHSCITKNVSNLKQVHPDFNLWPNHHAVIHIYDFLFLFGPVHSWWAFPFEHLVGILQCLPKNHISGKPVVDSSPFTYLQLIGELKNTMLQTYLKASKLCAWLSRPQCPQPIHECKILLNQAYEIYNSERDNKPQSCTAARLSTVPTDLQALIGQSTAVMHVHVKHMYVVYSRASMHIGNSLVLFYPQGNCSLPPVPGSIKYIYKLDRMPILAIQQQCPLPGGKKSIDPFTTYPHFPAKTYSLTLSETLEAVELAWIHTHYAHWAISDDCVVVLSLSHVHSLVPLSGITYQCFFCRINLHVWLCIGLPSPIQISAVRSFWPDKWSLVNREWVCYNTTGPLSISLVMWYQAHDIHATQYSLLAVCATSQGSRLQGSPPWDHHHHPSLTKGYSPS